MYLHVTAITSFLFLSGLIDSNVDSGTKGIAGLTLILSFSALLVWLYTLDIVIGKIHEETVKKELKR